MEGWKDGSNGTVNPLVFAKQGAGTFRFFFEF